MSETPPPRYVRYRPKMTRKQRAMMEHLEVAQVQEDWAEHVAMQALIHPPSVEEQDSILAPRDYDLPTTDDLIGDEAT